MMQRKNVRDLRHPCRIKKYPDGSCEIMACDKPIFFESGWEECDKPSKVPLPKKKEPCPRSTSEDGTDRAMRRAKSRVRDIALCNGFQYFVTLTLSASEVDRYDIKAIIKKLNGWCDNRVRRNGLKYVLVPERHKDGAIHFHGFFNGALEVVDSLTLSVGGKVIKPIGAKHRDSLLAKGAQIVYNLPSWSLGFTTAIEVYGDYSKAVGYVCKYIGKQGEKVGGRWYYSGGDLIAPDISYADITYSELEQQGAYTFYVDGAGLAIAILRTHEATTSES